MRLALLEDDLYQANLLQLWMQAAGYDCRCFNTGRSFIKEVGHNSYDLFIIDWMLPDISGDEVLTWVRQNVDWPIPVLFVTQRDSEQDIVHAFEQGADDYMVKPVHRLEMVARINALLRRTHGHPETKEALDFKPYKIDQRNRIISKSVIDITLTQKEYDLALFLFRNAGRVLSREHILESIWGRGPDVNTRTVDTHISRLRKKLDIQEKEGWRLVAIYQHGYRLEQLDLEASPAEQGGNI